ncbi:MAG TPA: hypothetical protein VFN74_20920 [Chloroflexota bacterium]|nr:hypothetical protein [Chloroflexota bacterium]
MTLTAPPPAALETDPAGAPSGRDRRHALIAELIQRRSAGRRLGRRLHPHVRAALAAFSEAELRLVLDAIDAYALRVELHFARSGTDDR